MSEKKPDIEIAVWIPATPEEAVKLLDESRELAVDYVSDFNKVVNGKIENVTDSRERTKILFACMMATTAYASANAMFQHPFIQMEIAIRSADIGRALHEFIASKGGLHHEEVAKMVFAKDKA